MEQEILDYIDNRCTACAFGYYSRGNHRYNIELYMCFHPTHFTTRANEPPGLPISLQVIAKCKLGNKFRYW